MSIEKRFVTCSGKTTKESTTIDAESDGAFVTDGFVKKALELATTATPTTLLTHHAKFDSDAERCVKNVVASAKNPNTK